MANGLLNQELQLRQPRYFGEPPLTPENIGAKIGGLFSWLGPNPEIKKIMDDEGVSAMEARRILEERQQRAQSQIISPEIQSALEAESARQEREYERGLLTGRTIDESGNVIGIRLPMTTGVEFATPQPTPEPTQETLLNVGPPAPMEQIGPPAPLLEVPMGKPTMTQKSDRFVGPLAPEEPQSLGQRARGLLSGIGNLMGVGQPDFRDRLVIGLGSMTMQPNNPLTQQAMANIQARRQQAATQEAYERQRSSALEEFQRQAQLERELQAQRIESAETIAANNAYFDALQAAMEKEGEYGPAEEEFETAMAQQVRDYMGNRADAGIDIEAAEYVLNLLETTEDEGDFKRAFFGTLQRDPNSNLSRFLTARFNQDRFDMQETIEQIVGKGLTDILGGNFAASENVNFMSRQFNPAATNAQNAMRLRRLIQSMQAQYETNESLMNHFLEFRNFRNWQGPTSLTSSLSSEFNDIVLTRPQNSNVPSFYQGN